MTYTNGEIVNIYIVCEISKNHNVSSYPKLVANGESFVIGNLILRIYVTIIYGQRITQFIYVSLLC